jgi:hypothetical protein
MLVRSSKLVSASSQNSIRIPHRTLVTNKLAPDRGPGANLFVTSLSRFLMPVGATYSCLSAGTNDGCRLVEDIRQLVECISAQRKNGY